MRGGVGCGEGVGSRPLARGVRREGRERVSEDCEITNKVGPFNIYAPPAPAPARTYKQLLHAIFVRRRRERRRRERRRSREMLIAQGTSSHLKKEEEVAVVYQLHGIVLVRV